MDSVWLSSSNIADHEGINHGICRTAVDKVIEYYQCSSSRAQTAFLLEQYILSGDTNRAMVVQFREYVRDIEQTNNSLAKLAEKWRNRPEEER